MQMLNLVFFNPVNLDFQQFYDIFCSECWMIIWSCKVDTLSQFNLNLFEAFVYDLIFTINLIFNLIGAMAS